MKNILIKAALSVSVLLAASCSDFLDKTPMGDQTEEDIFTKYTETERQISRLYFYVRSADRPLAFLRYISESPLCDEMESSNAESGWGNVFNEGGWEPGATIYDKVTSSTASGACHSFWPELYADIRRSNNILYGIEKYNTPDKVDAPGTLAERVGEVYFLRAYLHFVVMRNYGECTYLDYPVDPNDLPEFRRESIHDIVEKICNDCEEAMSRVPAKRTKPDEFGRVDKGACLGLMAMARWIAATPLYNGSTLKNDNRNYMEDYKEYKTERWEAAKVAAKAVIDFEYNGSKRYSLYQGSPKSSTGNSAGADESGGKVYSRLWELFGYGKTEAMENEWIWFVLHDKSTGWFTDVYPPSSSGSAREMPLQNQVDEYEVIGPDGCGYPIYALKENHKSLYAGLISAADMEASYDDADPYTNRDPRFYRDMLYHGAKFKKIDINTAVDNSGKGVTADAINATNSTTTGYFMRKFIDGYFSKGGTSSNVNAPPLIRLATIHLIYCEAVTRTDGATQEVYEMLNDLRERSFMAPMPAATVGNTNLMLDYINRERRVELFHEKTRFWTARLYLEATSQTEASKESQWNMMAGDKHEKAREYFNRYGAYPKNQKIVCGMKPVEDPDGKITVGGKKYKMERFWLEDRVFQEKHYLFPLPLEELQRAGIQQNPNW